MANNPVAPIPAQRFKFSDNQNLIPTTDFYSADFADVLNGDIPGSSTATSALSNLTGVLNTQTPGSNLLNSALNDVSAVGNTIEGAVSDVASVVGGVVNAVGQIAEEAVDAVCGLATDALDDALSIVNTAVGGVTGAVSSIFGGVLNDIPALGSLTSNCAGGLFKGSLGITGPRGSLCGIGGNCGGVLGSLVSEMTCNSNLSTQNPYSSLTNSLQSNFLSNMGSQALNSLGINNVLSGVSNCSSNPFSIQTMNGFALNTLQNGASTTQLLGFGSLGGPLAANIGNVGSMVPNALSNFTNNFTLPSNQVYNAIDSEYQPVSITAGAIQNAYDNISPGWNQSSVDNSPSISSLVGTGSSSSDLTNTATYGLYQNSAASLAAPYSSYSDTSNYENLNNSTADNGYAQTYLGMSSGSQNGINAVSNSVNSATSSISGSNVYGVGSNANIIQNQVSSLLSSSNSTTYTDGSGSQSTTGIFGNGSSNLSALYPNKVVVKSPTLYSGNSNSNLTAQQLNSISSILGNGSSSPSNASTPSSPNTPVSTTPTITSSSTPPKINVASIFGNGSSTPSTSSNSGLVSTVTQQAAQLSKNNSYNNQNSRPVNMTSYVASQKSYQQAKLAASSVIGSIPSAAATSAAQTYSTPTTTQLTNNLF